MSMGESHAHMRESMESTSAFSSTSASARSSLCLFTDSFLVFSDIFDIYAISRESSSS